MLQDCSLHLIVVFFFEMQSRDKIRVGCLSLNWRINDQMTRLILPFGGIKKWQKIEYIVQGLTTMVFFTLTRIKTTSPIKYRLKSALVWSYMLCKYGCEQDDMAIDILDPFWENWGLHNSSRH